MVLWALYRYLTTPMVSSPPTLRKYRSAYPSPSTTPTSDRISTTCFYLMVLVIIWVIRLWVGTTARYTIYWRQMRWLVTRHCTSTLVVAYCGALLITRPSCSTQSRAWSKQSSHLITLPSLYFANKPTPTVRQLYSIIYRTTYQT
jgi:hypothetical protein